MVICDHKICFRELNFSNNAFGTTSDDYPGVEEKILNALDHQIPQNLEVDLVSCDFDGDEFNDEEIWTIQVEIVP